MYNGTLRRWLVLPSCIRAFYRMTDSSRRTPPQLVLALALITAFGAWLRVQGLGQQVLQDDEWHALNMLAEAGYGRIAQSFGYADHSIPLTLLYKLVADTIGLTEVRMRAIQVACGIVVVPACGLLAWRGAPRCPAAPPFALVAGD